MPAILRAEGFALNPTKTRIQARHQAQTVTGTTVNRHVNLTRAAYDRLKSALHHLTTGRAPATPALLAHLSGRISWAEQLNPARAARLRASLASRSPPNSLNVVIKKT